MLCHLTRAPSLCQRDLCMRPLHMICRERPTTPCRPARLRTGLDTLSNACQSRPFAAAGEVFPASPEACPTVSVDEKLNAALAVLRQQESSILRFLQWQIHSPRHLRLRLRRPLGKGPLLPQVVPGISPLVGFSGGRPREIASCTGWWGSYALCSADRIRATYANM